MVVEFCFKELVMEQNISQDQKPRDFDIDSVAVNVSIVSQH